MADKPKNGKGLPLTAGEKPPKPASKSAAGKPIPPKVESPDEDIMELPGEEEDILEDTNPTPVKDELPPEEDDSPDPEEEEEVEEPPIPPKKRTKPLKPAPLPIPVSNEGSKSKVWVFITLGILALLLCLLTCLWVARTITGLEIDLKSAVLARDDTQKKYDQLSKDAQLMQLRNTVYREILKKWQLNIPGDKELETFSIDDYFCKVWCPWYQINLPKVRQEYKESNCNVCQTTKPAARPQPKPRVQREVRREPPTRESRPIRIVNPPPPPPTQPKDIIIPGPTVTCPQPKGENQ
jgi:hypothetical protein